MRAATRRSPVYWQKKVPEYTNAEFETTVKVSTVWMLTVAELTSTLLNWPVKLLVADACWPSREKAKLPAPQGVATLKLPIACVVALPSG